MNVKKSNLREIAYQRYQLKWMLEHGKSLEDLKNKLLDGEQFIKDCGDKATVSGAWDEFEEYGFDGEIYACYDEFLDNEFRDVDYMKTLLNKEEMEIWKEVRFASETDTFAEFSLTGDYSTYTLYVPDYTNLEIADVSELIEYTLHSILDRDGSGRDVKRILGFRKVKPELFEEIAESGECTITDLSYIADGCVEKVWMAK